VTHREDQQRDLGAGRDLPICVSGAKGTRTPDPLLAKQVRYQLRHSPRRNGRSRGLWTILASAVISSIQPRSTSVTTRPANRSVFSCNGERPPDFHTDPWRRADHRTDLGHQLECHHPLHTLACYTPDDTPRQIIGGPDPSPHIHQQLGLLASYSLITPTPESIRSTASPRGRSHLASLSRQGR
jgi:hypothetical protein